MSESRGVPGAAAAAMARRRGAHGGSSLLIIDSYSPVWGGGSDARRLWMGVDGELKKDFGCRMGGTS